MMLAIRASPSPLQGGRTVLRGRCGGAVAVRVAHGVRAGLPASRRMGSPSALSASSSRLFTAAPVLPLLPPLSCCPGPKLRSPLLTVAKAGYKLKTHKASAKRFRVTGSGKVVRRNAWRAHLLRKKSTKRKNRLAGMTEVFRGDLDNIVGAMPYLKVKRISRAATKNPIQAQEDTAEEGVES